MISIIEGSLTNGGKKATRKSTSSYRPAMGKSVVSMLKDVGVIKTGNSVRIQMSNEKWNTITEIIKSLGE